MNAKLFLLVSALLRLKLWVVGFLPRALLFLLLFIILSASDALSPTPRVYAADVNKHAGRVVHSADPARVVPRGTITWSGAGGDACWSNPANWDGGIAPGPFDIARLADSSRDAIVDDAFGDSVAGIVLDDGYSGTLQIARDLVVRGDVIIASGMLVTPADQALSVNTLEIRPHGKVRMGPNGKLDITGDGAPLTGRGALDTMTNQPNSIEFTGHNTSDLMAAEPLAGYRVLGLDKVVKDQRTGESSPSNRPLSFSESGNLTLMGGESYLLSAVIDTGAGFAYFGTLTSPGIVVKVRLSDFTRVGALTLHAGENGLVSAVIDATNGFAYFGTGTGPGIVVKVKLSDFTRVDALTLNPEETNPRSAVIDTSAGFAYFGTHTVPGIVVKVRLSDFTHADALTLKGGENYINSAVIDTGAGLAYFGTNTTPGIVVKVNLSDFTLVDALTLNEGETGLYTALIDPSNDFAYFAADTSPAIVVKVRLSNLTRVGGLTLNAGEIGLASAVIDPPNGFVYFGTATFPGIVVKVKLSDFTRVGALTLNAGKNLLLSAVIDPPNGFAYFSTSTAPGIVVKVDLSEKLYLPLIKR